MPSTDEKRFCDALLASLRRRGNEIGDFGKERPDDPLVRAERLTGFREAERVVEGFCANGELRAHDADVREDPAAMEDQDRGSEEWERSHAGLAAAARDYQWVKEGLERGESEASATQRLMRLEKELRELRDRRTNLTWSVPGSGLMSEAEFDLEHARVTAQIARKEAELAEVKTRTPVRSIFDLGPAPPELMGSTDEHGPFYMALEPGASYSEYPLERLLEMRQDLRSEKAQAFFTNDEARRGIIRDITAAIEAKQRENRERELPPVGVPVRLSEEQAVFYPGGSPAAMERAMARDRRISKAQADYHSVARMVAEVPMSDTAEEAARARLADLRKQLERLGAPVPGRTWETPAERIGRETAPIRERRISEIEAHELGGESARAFQNQTANPAPFRGIGRTEVSKALKRKLREAGLGNLRVKGGRGTGYGYINVWSAEGTTGFTQEERERLREVLHVTPGGNTVGADYDEWAERLGLVPKSGRYTAEAIARRAQES